MLEQFHLRHFTAAARAGLGSRPLRFGTDCSGAEAPWFALKAISSELAAQLSLSLEVQHRFACDIQAVSRQFIVQNSQPWVLFSDLLERLDTGYCLQAKMMVPVPSQLDLYVAGFPCKDFSILNSNRPCLQGPHASTFHGVVEYIKRHQPATFLLENVQGLTMKKKGQAKAPITEVMEILRSLEGYQVKGWSVNSFNYHLPQNRMRVYIVGVHCRAKLLLPLDAWSSYIREDMACEPQVPAHSFLLDDAEVEVQAELERLETYRAEHGRTEIAGREGRWKATHDNLRKELGVRPDEGPLIPKGCGWSRFLSQRTQDTLELQAFRMAKKQGSIDAKDVASSKFFAEISRSVLYGSFRESQTPCPSVELSGRSHEGIPGILGLSFRSYTWKPHLDLQQTEAVDGTAVGNRIWGPDKCSFVVGELSNVARYARWLIGPEMLALQGFPVDELNLEGIKDQECDVSAGCWAVSVPYPPLLLRSHWDSEQMFFAAVSLADGVRYLILAFVQFDGEPLAEPGCPDVPVTVLALWKAIQILRARRALNPDPCRCRETRELSTILTS
ncbi:unnamed protein product [Cladocopium goreaui]|uniref:DNA (cytosine-5-)-methyltransferase n=1 Tax=Cladocopium goreaui TaxID=2562237 RepID=A0A9P1GRU3_9DINO|nr:unnamed protein product [Cladocopium goreaui]